MCNKSNVKQFFLSINGWTVIHFHFFYFSHLSKFTSQFSQALSLSPVRYIHQLSTDLITLSLDSANFANVHNFTYKSPTEVSGTTNTYKVVGIFKCLQIWDIMDFLLIIQVKKEEYNTPNMYADNFTYMGNLTEILLEIPLISVNYFNK